jgi:hypothetical protein
MAFVGMEIFYCFGVWNYAQDLFAPFSYTLYEKILLFQKNDLSFWWIYAFSVTLNMA